MHRYIKGMAITFMGVAATILAYASGESWHFDRRIVGWSSATGLVAFILVCVLARRSSLSLAQGILVGYGSVVIVIMLLVLNSLQDAESRMWLPVVVIVAAIYGFPIAFAASVGGRMAGLSKNEKPAEQGASSNR